MNLGEIVKEVTGTFQYYAIAVDSTILVALSTIVSEQANPTNKTMNKLKKFLNYVASHQYAIVTYHASDMIFSYHSNSY